MIKSTFFASLVAVALGAPEADPALLYSGLPYIGKREAEAEPAVLAGSSKILTPPTPFIHNPPVLRTVAAPAVYGYGLPYGHYIGKRSADADPQFLAYSGLPYAAALPAAGAVAHPPVVKSVVESPAEVKQEVTAHALPVAAYHGYGLGHFGYLG